MIGVRVMAPLVLALALAPAGCGNKGEGAAAAPSSKPAASAAPPLRNAAGKLSKPGFDAAWQAIYLARGSEREPAEKKMAAFEASVGKPARMDGTDRIYWTFEGDTCFKVTVGPEGGKSSQTVPAEKCEK